MTKQPSIEFPPLPEGKRYFNIGEVSALCNVKQHVLRYWEQEFPHLRPDKRRGNRRAYRPKDVLLIRRIRELLYDNGFTISGARLKLSEKAPAKPPAQQQMHSLLAETIKTLEDIASELDAGVVV